MRYRVNTYEIAFGTLPDAIMVQFPVSEEVYFSLGASYSAELTRAVTEAVRLIANETRGGVIIMSTGQKTVVQYVTKYTATVSGATVYKVNIRIPIANLITLADGDEDEIAAINAMTTTDMYTIEMDWGDVSEQGSYSEQLAQFFGLPEALPDYEYATEAEVIAINDDVMGIFYGYGKVSVKMHCLMRTGSDTTQDLECVIYVDPTKSWAQNGYPTLYNAQGTAINTATNPTAGDVVYNYQTQNS